MSIYDILVAVVVLGAIMFVVQKLPIPDLFKTIAYVVAAVALFIIFIHVIQGSGFGDFRIGR